MSKFVRSIKNVASGYSSVQVIVRNATSNDPSGPTTYEMEEIAANTYSSQTDFLEIMDMLDRRLNDKGKNWRHVAKSLTVLDYLIRYGSDKCVLWSKDNLYIIKTLREFIHFDEANNDQGAIIRVKAKELVSLLRDDERLRQERSLASSNGRSSSRNDNRPASSNRPKREARNGNQPYDEDLERALEISRITAEEERRRAAQESDDPDLQAALKLSIEEEEMRSKPVSATQNQDLLDLNDEPSQPQYYMATGYYQPQQQVQQQPQQYFQQQQQTQQYDLFGNPIQNLNTGYFQPQQFFQPQQTSQPTFTGFQQFQPQAQESLQPLKTGSNNPFALPESKPQQSVQQPAQTQTQQFQPVQHQQTQVQQPQKLQSQNTSSKYNDDTHSELNNLLAQATGLDTFGNTGATRIPHQYTKTQNFVNSSGTGYKQQTGEVRLSSNATGNPFLQQSVVPSASYAHPQINPAYTGYGFGNAAPQQQNTRTDGPSLIDI